MTPLRSAHPTGTTSRGTSATRVARVSLVAAVAVGSIGATTLVAHASNTPPSADSRLFGTWLNTNAATNSIKQIVLSNDGSGGLMVDAFGACTPTFCEFGNVPAIVYGANVGSTAGDTFSVNQREYGGGATEFARSVMIGQAAFTARASKLTLSEYQTFEDGSGRHNYVVAETFVKGSGQAVATSGSTGGNYPTGLEPAPVSGLVGTWNNVSTADPGVVQIVVTLASDGSLLVHQYGNCTPAPCDNGTVAGITYGTSISATTGKSFLAPWAFSFKNQLLSARLVNTSSGLRLKVTNLSEFTDGSGRSNYVLNETFAKA